MANFVLNISKARRDFKQLIGQTNHFLITILVGLDAVSKNEATISPEFSTIWNPKDVQISSTRSRQFAIKATLSWCVDAIDAYYVMAAEKPAIIQNDSLKQIILQEKSIFRKFKAMKRYYRSTDLSVEIAMIELAITWRNRLVHFNSDNTIDRKTRDLLTRSKEYLKDNYQGLDVDNLLGNYDSSFKSIPRFKEVTSFIRAIHKYVEILDGLIIDKLDYDEICEETISSFLHAMGEDEKTNRINSIWSKDAETTLRKLKNILIQNGFEETKDNKKTKYQIDITSPFVNLGVKRARAKF